MSLIMGAIILNNALKIKKWVSGNYSIQGVTQEKTEIQMMVQRFSDYFRIKIEKLYGYMFMLKFSTTEGYEGWINEVKKVEKGFLQKGDKIFNEIISVIEKRKLSTDDYGLLRDILENQMEIAEGILEQKLDMDSLEEIIAYIKDAPNYLKFDLQVEKLPFIEEKVETIITRYNSQNLNYMTSHIKIEFEAEKSQYFERKTEVVIGEHHFQQLKGFYKIA
ncbi:hypothetical protein Q9R46_26120 [Paenibacillus sp. RRE4]|uniref:hypothetical protein n=1 Tax=Paenibacillus sp. RRE4 TaxID=2962587 RepID=UPI00288213FF|nr:hypothetical protein [Paenibacillus sp. RRE4]MDT0126147.1 hypothetical protein [Paenibacillus sp. RRE4]